MQLGDSGLPACSLASSQTGAVAAATSPEQHGTCSGSRPSPEAGSGTIQRLKPDAEHQAGPAGRCVPHEAAGSPGPVRHDSAASLVLDTAKRHQSSRLSTALPGLVTRKLATCSRDGWDTGSQVLQDCCHDQQQAQEVSTPAAAGAATGISASSSSQVVQQQRPAGTASIPRLHLTPPRASSGSDPGSCAASPEQAGTGQQRHQDCSLDASMHTQGQGLPVPKACRVWVVQWLDYTSKYGMGYVLSSGACGVLFNDRSRLLLAPDAQTFTYVQRSSHGGSSQSQELASVVTPCLQTLGGRQAS